MNTDYKALSRGVSRDMSPEAIARRLQIASELFDVAIMLHKARCVGKVEPGDADRQAEVHCGTSDLNKSPTTGQAI